jgi:hypothetical protein
MANDDGTCISHKDCIHKTQPLPLEKDRQTHQPMSAKEHTLLRQSITGQFSMASSSIFSSHPSIYVLARGQQAAGIFKV